MIATYKTRAGLFQMDRRATVRFDAPERRSRLRAKPRLKIYGFIAAIVFEALICWYGLFA